MMIGALRKNIMAQMAPMSFSPWRTYGAMLARWGV
jgi:hypothetical protein